MNRVPGVLSMLPFTVLTLAPAAGAADKTELDISRVALFSSGVGYFEREATVSGGATAELSFRTEQINDIIKSMVVQDFGGGKIGVISYASQDPIEKTLRSFGVNLTGKPSLGELLDQLRGEPVRITGPRTIEGTIVGVDREQVLGKEGQVLQTIERLTLLTVSGLQRIPLNEIQGIELTNEKIAAELNKALATLARAHDADKKSVRVSFEGSGERRVRVAYLLEAPIWKTTYRLVLGEGKAKAEGQDAKGKAGAAGGQLLQGWATIENATESDWNNVRLSLVSGRPISFRMDLYTPLYVPRPLVQMELYASLRPPEYEGGIRTDKAISGDIDKDGLQESARTMTRRMAGGRGGVWAPSAAAAPAPAAAEAVPEGWQHAGAQPLSLDDAGVASVATAEQAGELFAYHIDTPVTIPRQTSAMLPIVNQAIEATKLSIYNPATHAKYPLNGLELKNTTGLNLMQGPITLFEDNVYAGDARLPDLKPNEKRLVGYALDLGTEVIVNSKPAPVETISLKLAKGTLWHRRKYVDAREYVLKNKQDRDKTVLIEQPYSSDWQLIEPKEAYDRTQNVLRFKAAVAADQTATFPVRLERVADEAVALTNIGVDAIVVYLRGEKLSPGVRKALERVVALRNELDEVARRRAKLEQAHREQTAEQGRIRENLKTLDKSTDSYQRQLKQFDQIDARIAELGQQIGTAREEEEAKRQALDQYLVGLDVE